MVAVAASNSSPSFGAADKAGNSDPCDYKQIRQRWHVPVPAGWVLNEEASDFNDANVFLPPGKNQKNTDRQMAIKADLKSDPELGPTLGHFTNKSIRHYQSLYGGGPSSDAISIPAGAGGAIRLYSFKPGKKKDLRPSYASSVFIEDQHCFIDVFLEAYSQEAHDANLSAFK